MNDFKLPAYADYVTKAEKSESVLIEGMLPKGIALLYGREKSGKSLFAAALAKAAAKGEDFLGYRIPNKLRVLYMALDDRESTIVQRFKGIDDSMLRIYTYNNYINELNTIYGDMGDLQQKHLTIDSFNAFLRRVIVDGSYRPDLVVIDTFAKVRDPSHERDYESEVAEIQRLRLYEDLGVNFLLVSHKRKTADEYIGSAGMGAECDVLMDLDDLSNEVKKLKIRSNYLPSTEIGYKIDFNDYSLKKVSEEIDAEVDKDIREVLTILHMLPNQQFVGPVHDLAFLPRMDKSTISSSGLGRKLRHYAAYIKSESVYMKLDVNCGHERIALMKIVDHELTQKEENDLAADMINQYKGKKYAYGTV